MAGLRFPNVRKDGSAGFRISGGQFWAGRENIA
jgi:hypothetical protein